jgi:hypothetical protein
MTGRRHAAALLTCLLLLLVAGDCLAQPAPSGLIYASPPNGVYVAVAPGAGGVITIEVRNPQAFEVPAGTLYGSGLWQSDTGYTMTPAGASPCAAPVLPPTALGRFTIARPAMPPGGLLRCQYRLERTPSSPSTRAIQFGELCSVGGFNILLCAGPTYFTGTLGDVGISAQIVGIVPPGATSALARFTLSNNSPTAIMSSSFGTCDDFPNGFRFASDVADACAFDPGNGPFCFLDSRGWRAGPIPAKGTAHCNLRVVFGTPLTSPRSAFVEVIDWRYDGDVSAWDTNRANDRVVLGVAPAAAVPVPLGTWMSGVMVLALGLTGSIALAHAAGRRRPTARRDEFAP